MVNTHKLTISLKKTLSVILAISMLLTCAVFAASADPAEEGYVLEAKDLTAFAAGAKADKETQKINDVFTLLWSAKSKVDSSTKTWTDNYTSGQRINFGGSATTEMNSIKLSLDGGATVKVWWVAGGADRQIGILDSQGAAAAVTTGTVASGDVKISELEVTEGGTYYLGGSGGNNYIFKVQVIPSAKTYVLEAKNLDAFAAGAKADKETQKIDDVFTLLWSAKSKVDSSTKTWTDNYTSGQRINFGGSATTEMNAIKLSLNEKATVKVWWVAGGADRQIGILDSQGATAAVTTGTVASGDIKISDLELTEGGTYYLGGSGGNNYIFKVEVTTGAVAKPPRADWSEVATPTIDSVAVDETNARNIKVTVSGLVGHDGADNVAVTMTGTGSTKTLTSAMETDTHTITFTPTASGTYTFSVKATREGEDDHVGTDSDPIEFTLPLEKPYVKTAANAGGGAVTVEWDPVAEADSYVISVGDADAVTVTELTGTVTGLTVGQEYSIKVRAKRGNEDGPASDAKQVTITDEAETVWYFVTFGPSTSTSANGSEGNANTGSVRVYSTGGKGKLQPTATDGVAFYYTKLDPKTQNFELTATANVNTWTYSNGQEGFGLMASDVIGEHGSSNSYWTNSYMVNCTKVEYTLDGTKISMKLGVGAQEKIGVTPDNIDGSSLKDASKLLSKMTTLETSCLPLGAGTYNLVDKSTNAPDSINTVDNPYSTFKFTLGKSNTGYYASYDDPISGVNKVQYYEPLALNALDENVIYVGFFASRNADITFTDITFTTSDPATDPPAEERPTVQVDPNYLVESATVANSEDYTLVFYANADGNVTVNGGDAIAVTANQKLRLEKKLTPGQNNFKVVMTPNEDYKPSDYEVLSSYEPVEINHIVNFAVNSQEVVYVAPNGSASASGVKEAPQDIYTAVNRAIPGQTIYLKEGTYSLSDRLVIERGINGEENNLITLAADPDAKTRPVLDFGGKSAGIVLAGDWWHFKGFDVTNSKNGEKGVQVSGNHNILEELETYRNGNTGIQISRYKGTDKKDEWPAYNLILNCTSYLNADAGYEDADGFAAKLTVSEGNVFDGCIACYNADDGWDLFAKPETGPIGMVTIKNSVAYMNGYLLDSNGGLVNAGNGNGFKMGGSSISGYHTLDNSVAFANKAKGIDSNSCPDIQAYQSTSFDNESYNIAFYTNDAKNTDFQADGVLSYKKTNSVSENFKTKGTQEDAKINKTTNYYFNGSKSVNTENAEVSDSWFVSLDTAKVLEKGITKNTGKTVDLGYITRNSDGTINMHGYLVLTEDAPDNVGARLSVEPEEEEQPEEQPDVPVVVYDPTESDADAEITAKELEEAIESGEPISVELDNPIVPGSDETVKIEMPANVAIEEPVKVAIPVKDATQSTIAYVKEADGTLTPVKECYLDENGELVVPVDGSCEIVIADNKKEFDDVKENIWYAESVEFVTARGIFNGNAGSFMPDLPMDRAMAAQILFNLTDNAEAANGAAFSDVANDSWYKDAVAWASDAGVMNGYAGKFAPEKAISRQDFITALYRFAQARGYKIDDEGDLSAFKDAGDVSDYAFKPMVWAVKLGIINGSNGYLYPNNELIRAEAAAIAERFIKNT